MTDQDDIALRKILEENTTMKDFTISREALITQAQVARSVGRIALAGSFERASELIDVPDTEILRIYELLRPGRSKDRQDLVEAAELLRTKFGAHRLFDYILEAATEYERHGIFTKRF